MTEPRALQQVDRTYVRQGKHKLSYFGGCDYFRLASDPRVLAALRRSLDEFGLNVAASRLTTGNHRLYGELEVELARFFKTEAAVCVSAGYLGNLVVAQSLAGSFSHVLLDEQAHISLVDAAQFFDCPILKFKHRDAADCARALQRCGKGARPAVLTDGMFARDGSVAPLKEYLKLLPGDGLLLVDDAHGAGVLGKNGRGAAEHCDVEGRQVMQTTTLSKAFGVYGGVILGTRELRERIMAKSRVIIGNTPLPLPLAGAAVTAIGIVKRDRNMRARLARNAEQVKRAVRSAGLTLPDHPGPIIPIFPNTASEANRLKRVLHTHRIHAPFILYPNGPDTGYFRFVISSEHTPGQLNDLIAAITEWLNRR